MTNRQITPFRFTECSEEFEKLYFKEVNDDLNAARKEKFYSHNMYRYSHGLKWITSPTEIENDNTSEMELHVTELDISKDKLVNRELSELIIFKEAYISKVIKEQVASMYQTISRAADESGGIIKSKTEAFQADHFIEMLEKIDLSVSIDGTVSLPEIHASPSLSKTIIEVLSSQGSEFQDQVDEIIQKKEQHALEAEKKRKAKFPS